MALAGSPGAAPGLTADTPGAPPGAPTPPCPGAASLGVGPPDLVLATKQPGYSHPGPSLSTLELSAHY